MDFSGGSKKIVYLSDCVGKIEDPAGYERESNVLVDVELGFSGRTVIVRQPSSEKVKNIVKKHGDDILFLIINTNLQRYDDGLEIYKELQDLPEPIVLLTYKTEEDLGVTLRQQDLYWQKADAERDPKPFVKALQQL